MTTLKEGNNMNKSQEISDVLTPEGIDKLKAGQILIFNYEGTRNELKITKINKKSHRAWAIPIKTYTQDQVGVFGPKSFETFTDYKESLDE